MEASSRSSTMLRHLLDAVWRFRRRALAALLLLMAAKVAGLMVPMLLKVIVDQFSQATGQVMSPAQVLPIALPVFLLLGYALLRFASTLFTELRDLVFARVTQRTVTGFAERAFAHLLALDAPFHVRRNTGALIREVERGTAGVGFLLGAGLFTLVPTLFELLAVLLIMAVNYRLTFSAVIVLTFAVYAAYTTVLTQRRELHQRQVNEMDSAAHARLLDALLNYDTIKSHAREAYERERYAEICGGWVETSVRNQLQLSKLHVGQGAIIAVGVALMMLLAGQATLERTMTVGDLVLVNAYVIQICLPLNALGFVFRQARDATVDAERLFALLDQPPAIADATAAVPLQLRGGAVRFEHVDFAYEPGRQILHDLSLEIAPGQTVAVVGGSGSGKSTLARLLLRLYDVGGGRISIDGQDLRTLRLDSLRQAIGIVPQDTTLFNDTIAYNIGYGRRGAGMADIVAAAQAAQVHEFIQTLPQQYDTVVGERGLKLSGGEKQRIAIARAFLKNPPIMIFDEATSALDTRAERAIQGELDRIAQGRTALVIAHRLSTIVGADAIVVLDKGRIVEQGRHDELLARDGLYAQLWKLQREQQQFERLQRHMARQPVNLAALLANAIEGLREAAEARRVGLFTDIDPHSASVTGDPSTLAGLLRDLALWLVDTTPPGGRAELTLGRRDGNARLTATAGSSADAAPAAAASAAPPPDPLALRSVVERQGGTYLCERAGGGMRHVIELPLRVLATPAPGPGLGAVRPPAPASLQGMRILFIDDQAEAREALQALLELDGAAVLPFGSGREAVAWLDRHPAAMWPDIVLCDIALGEDEDGHAVLRRIRQIEARRDVPLARRIPAIALSGLAQPDDRIRALMAGFQMHLGKPVDAQELVVALHALGHGAGAGHAGAAAPPPEAAAG